MLACTRTRVEIEEITKTLPMGLYLISGGQMCRGAEAAAAVTISNDYGYLLVETRVDCNV